MNVKQLVTDSQKQRGGLERGLLLSSLVLPVCGVSTDAEPALPVCGVCTDVEPSTGARIAFQGPHP